MNDLQRKYQSGEIEPEAYIQELERRLAAAELNLQALAGTQFDAIMERGQTTPLLLRQAQLALQRSNELLEQRVAERTAALAESEMKYRALFENSLDMVFLTRTDGTIVDANPAACQALGLTRAEICARGRAGIIQPASPNLEEGLKRRAATSRAQGELTFIRKDGSTFLAEVDSVIVNPQWSDWTTFVTARDITERKQAEEALRESEKLQRLAMEGAQLGAWSNDLLTGSTYWDARTRKIFGVSTDEPLSVEKGFSIILPEDRERAKQAFENAVSPDLDGLYELEKRILHPDGSVRWVATKGQVSFEGQDRQRRAVRLVGVVQDITARKQAEQDLRESEERFRTVWEITSDAMALSDPNGIVIAANPAYSRLYGYPLEEVIGHTFAVIFPENERFRAQQQYLDVFKNPVVPPRFELTIQQKDGQQRIVETKIAFLEQDGSRIAMLSTIRDITERRLAEAALKRSEHLYRMVAANLPNGAAFLIDQNLRYLLAEGQGLAQLGMSPTDFEGKTIWEALDPELARLYEPTYRQALRGELFQWEHHSHGRDYLSRGTPVLDEQGQVVAALAMSYDITERKQAEQAVFESNKALQESELRLRIAQDAAQLGIHDYDIRNNKIYWDDRVRELWGIPPDQVITYDVFIDGLYPEDKVPTQAAVDRALDPTGNRDYYTEYRVISQADHVERWVAATGKALFDQGIAVRLVGTVQEITQRKQAEAERERLLKEVQRQKDLFEHLIQHSPIGIAVLEGPEHRFVLVNPAQNNLFPMIPDFTGHTVAEVWPDQREVFKPILDRVFQTGEPFYAIDAPWQTDKGQGLEEAFYTFSYTPIYQPNGVIEGILVLSLETTEQVKARQRLQAELDEHRQMEAALQESESRFRSMADGTPVMIWVHGPNGKMEFVNQAYTDYFGVTLEQVQTEGWQPLVHPEDRSGYVDVFIECSQQHRTFRAQCRVRRPDGQWYWLDSHGQPRFSATGEFIGMAGSSFDITHRKQAEEANKRYAVQLEQLNRDLAFANRELKDFTYVASHDLQEPLRKVSQFGRLLQMNAGETLTEDNQAYLDRMVDAAKRMQEMIAGLLDYSRITTQGNPFKRVRLITNRPRSPFRSGDPDRTDGRIG